MGASPGGDVRGMARFSGIQQLLQVVAINPVGRVRWDDLTVNMGKGAFNKHLKAKNTVRC